MEGRVCDDDSKKYVVRFPNPLDIDFKSGGDPVYADLTDVTLADEDTNSILNDNAKRAIQGNVMQHLQVSQPDGQLWNQCKWRHLMTKF